ncbi:MAG: hypothetical protein JOS17DRAFT_752561 [Linnemannia elongata]|nr:MAG: hypothetical protein JOS17DRAFT_752561 [Linnemannia elongata]
MLPPLLSSIQAAIQIVSNAVMPRKLHPSDSLTATPQAFANDAVSTGPFDATLAPTDEISGPDPIKPSLSSSSSSSSAEGRSLSSLPIAKTVLAPRSCMEKDEEWEKEEEVMDEYNFEYTSTASEGPFLPAPATSMEEYEEDLFDTEDYPIPQVELPEYDPNDPLWMYIHTWQMTPGLPDPFIHIPAQYHKSLETYLNTHVTPLPQEEAVDYTDSSLDHDLVPLGAGPNTQAPATLHGPATTAPMTEYSDDQFINSTTLGPWSALWVMGDDDEVPNLREGWAQFH